MPKRRDDRPEHLTSGRRQWLLRAIREVSNDRNSARAAGSWSAVAALHRQAQSLRGEYDLEAERERMAQEDAKPAGPMTLEERIEHLQRIVPAWDDAELEIALAEWLDRKKYHLEVDERGILHLRRRGTTLQLVEG